MESSAAADRPTLAWRSRRPVVMAFGIAAAALILCLVTWRSDTAALRSLPADQRAAVAGRALSNLREVCLGPDRPRDFCREQAQIALQLPECGEDCQAAARDELLADTAVR